MEGWERTMINWVNAMPTNSSPIARIKDIKKSVEKLVTTLTPDSTSVASFLTTIFPKYFDNDLERIISTDFDYLCSATAILIYIAFTTKDELEPYRQIMCSNLDSKYQENIAYFLTTIKEKYENIYNISFENVKSEIYEFVKVNSQPQTTMIGDGVITTPQKAARTFEKNDSPLLEFFQTPKKRTEKKQIKHPCTVCCDGDRIKKIKSLEDQLMEEDIEKSSLQEKLIAQIQKCADYERKLKSKTQQLQDLEKEWAGEAKKNEEKLRTLHGNIQKKSEEEARLKNEVAHLEKYVSELEGDLSTSAKLRDRTEHQLQEILERNKKYEMEVTEASQKISELTSHISVLENQLTSIKESYPYIFQCDMSYDGSFVESSFDASISTPENMGVVIDKILSERTAENATLKETIEEIKNENEVLKNDIADLQERVEKISSEKSELTNMNKQLSSKLEEFNKVRQVLEAAECKLVAYAQELDQLTKEKKELVRKSNDLSGLLKCKDDELEVCKKSNELLKMDYAKLTEDYKRTQKKLEEELENVSKLTSETEEKHLQLQRNIESFTELKMEHENAKKSIEYVESKMKKSLGKLESLLSTDSELSEDSFSSCLSVESKIDKLTDLLDKLEAHNLETAESRAVLEKTCIQLNESLVSLKSEISELEEKQRSSIKEKLDLEEFLQVTENKIVDLQNLYTEKIEKLKEELEEKEKMIRELSKNVEESDMNKKILMEEKEELTKELERIMGQYLEAEEKIKNLEGELNERKMAHSMEMMEATSELERLKNDVNILNEKNLNLNLLMEENKKKLSDSYVEIKNLKDLHDKKIEEKNNLLKEKEIQIYKIENFKIDLENDLEEIELKNRNIQEELEATVKELNELKIDSEREKSELMAKYELLGEKCLMLEGEKEKVEKQLIQVKMELETATKELSEIINSQKCVIAEAEEKIKEAKNEKEMKLNELKNIKKQRDELLKRLDSTSTELLSVQDQRDKIHKENEKISEELKKASEELQIVTEELNDEINKRNDLEIKLSEERKSVESLVSEVEELENQKEKIARLSREMKYNMSGLKIILSKISPDSQELKIIYDACREITESASMLSIEDNDLDLNSETFSQASSGIDITEKNISNVEIEMEELNREIIIAKRSLVEFLKASVKHFEVLKLKENSLEEMAKQQMELENRISSLNELNTRLTKEILESKSSLKIEIDFKEQELESLKAEVDSLNKASSLLKEKLGDLEKVNEMLIKKKEENLLEIAALKERNKALRNDLQNKVMAQLRQQNSYYGLIKCKQETELEMEKKMKFKDDLEKKINDLRKIILNHENKIGLEILLSTIEQKFYIASQKLLQCTFSFLKWGEKNMEYQCRLIEENDAANDEAKENLLKEEQEVIKDKLKQTDEMFKAIFENLNDLEGKCNAKPDIFSDSLEEVSVANKTFDIVNLEEHNVNNRTFSIENHATHIPVKKDTGKAAVAAWVVSPPSKNVKPPPKPVKKERVNGESWVVPFEPPAKPKKIIKPEHRSNLELSSKPSKESEKLSKSSSVADIDYSPPSKKDSKSSGSFVSCDVEIKKEVESPKEEEGNSTVTLERSEFEKPVKLSSVENLKRDSGEDVVAKEKLALEKKIWNLQKDILENVKENEKLKNFLFEAEQKRKKDKEVFEKNQEMLKKEITEKYEGQLDHLKAEMKSLYNRELAKHKAEQSKLNSELRQQNKAYKEHIDELRNQLWDLGEKLLNEQKLKRDLERNCSDIKNKYEKFAFPSEQDSKASATHNSDFFSSKDGAGDDFRRMSTVRQLPNFPTIPTEDEDEVFDNRCLEDMKAGICQVDGPEGRLTELQYRNSLCLPHLKSSYPAETQFHNPKMYKENDLKFGHLQFGQESQSLTDSDHSMTKSLLPEDKTKKKEQTSYKRPGPPTPSKNGGRLSLQSGDLRLTPRNILKEQNEIKGTPSRLKMLFTSKNSKRDSIGCKDENTAPGTPRGKKLKIFRPRKPFGGREY